MLLSYALRLPRRMAVRRCNLHRRVLSNGVSIRYFLCPRNECAALIVRLLIFISALGCAFSPFWAHPINIAQEPLTG